jgi:hypothetical protein
MLASSTTGLSSYKRYTGSSVVHMKRISYAEPDTNVLCQGKDVRWFPDHGYDGFRFALSQRRRNQVGMYRAVLAGIFYPERH